MVLPNDEQQSKEKEKKRVDTLYQQKVNESSLNTQKVNHISQSTQCNIETADDATQVQEGIIST